MLLNDALVSILSRQNYPQSSHFILSLGIQYLWERLIWQTFQRDDTTHPDLRTVSNTDITTNMDMMREDFP